MCLTSLNLLRAREAQLRSLQLCQPDSEQLFSSLTRLHVFADQQRVWDIVSARGEGEQKEPNASIQPRIQDYELGSRLRLSLLTHDFDLAELILSAGGVTLQSVTGMSPLKQTFI